MFSYTTVRRDPDGQFTLIRYLPKYYFPLRYYSMAYASMVAAAYNGVELNKELDPYLNDTFDSKRYHGSIRDAGVWARLDVWQKAQDWSYILKNTPHNSHIGNLAPRFSSGGYVK